MERKIVGIVGHSGCGKDLVSDVFTKHGFVSIRLSDAIRKYAEDNRINIKNTNDLVNLGNWLRVKEGPDILPRLVAQSHVFKHADRVVINGIRNPSEVDYLHEYHDAIVFGIEVPEEKLLEYLIGRKREGDPTDRDGFLRMLAREKGLDGNSGMDVPGCLSLSDLKIFNTKTKQDLEYEVTKYIHGLGIETHGNRHEMHGHGRGHEHI